MKTIIIGKDSNLSRTLAETIDECILVSSREILKDIKTLSKHFKHFKHFDHIEEGKEDEKINIIFNNFQAAVKLRSFDNYETLIKNSIDTTVKVIDYLQGLSNEQKERINKIIYSSSSSVYGSNEFCSETDPVNVTNLHSSMKILNENIIKQFCINNNIDFTIARIFNIFGSKDKFSVVSKILDAYKNKSTFTMANNGSSIRDFIHVQDIANVYKILLNTKSIDIINIGGNPDSVSNIVKYINKYTNETINTKNIELKEIHTSISDNSKMLSIYKDDLITVDEYIKTVIAEIKE